MSLRGRWVDAGFSQFDYAGRLRRLRVFAMFLSVFLGTPVLAVNQADIARQLSLAQQSVKSGRFSVVGTLWTGAPESTRSFRRVTVINENGLAKEDYHEDGYVEIHACSYKWFTTYDAPEASLEQIDRSRWPMIKVQPVGRIAVSYRQGFFSDIRNIMSEGAGMHSGRLEPVLDLSVKLDAFSAEDQIADGKNLLVISFARSFENATLSGQATIDVSHTPRIISLLAERGFAGRVGYREKVLVQESAAAEITAGVWFPRQIQIRKWKNAVLESDENLEITVSEVNKKFDQSEFEPPAMGFPDGIVAMKYDADGNCEYQVLKHGVFSTMSPVDWEQRKTLPVKRVQMSSRQIVLLLASAVYGVCVFGMLLFRWVYRARNKASSSPVAQQ